MFTLLLPDNQILMSVKLRLSVLVEGFALLRHVKRNVLYRKFQRQVNSISGRIEFSECICLPVFKDELEVPQRFNISGKSNFAAFLKVNTHRYNIWLKPFTGNA